MFLFRITKFFNIFYEVECFFVYQHYNCRMWKTNQDKIRFQELSHFLRSFRWHDDDFFFMDIFPDWMIGKGRFFWLRSHCPAFIVFHCSVLMWKLDEVSETQKEMIINIFLGSSAINIFKICIWRVKTLFFMGSSNQSRRYEFEFLTN